MVRVRVGGAGEGAACSMSESRPELHAQPGWAGSKAQRQLGVEVRIHASPGVYAKLRRVQATMANWSETRRLQK